MVILIKSSYIVKQLEKKGVSVFKPPQANVFPFPYFIKTWKENFSKVFRGYRKE